jgi:hypothetical protein
VGVSWRCDGKVFKPAFSLPVDVSSITPCGGTFPTSINQSLLRSQPNLTIVQSEYCQLLHLSSHMELNQVVLSSLNANRANMDIKDVVLAVGAVWVLARLNNLGSSIGRLRRRGRRQQRSKPNPNVQVLP